jgi:hypothetical protein
MKVRALGLACLIAGALAAPVQEQAQNNQVQPHAAAQNAPAASPVAVAEPPVEEGPEFPEEETDFGAPEEGPEEGEEEEEPEEGEEEGFEEDPEEGPERAMERAARSSTPRQSWARVPTSTSRLSSR